MPDNVHTRLKSWVGRPAITYLAERDPESKLRCGLSASRRATHRDRDGTTEQVSFVIFNRRYTNGVTHVRRCEASKFADMQLKALLSILPFYIAFASGAATGGLSARANAPILDAQTDAFIENMIKEWNSPGGISVSYVKQNSDGSWQTEYKGYGVANGKGDKVNENTYFNIASNTKLLNVMSTGILIDNPSLSKKPINWHTKMIDIIPEWNTTDPTAKSDATLLDCMSHRTGYPLHDFSYHYSDTVETVTKKLGFHRPAAEFRDIWLYNNVVFTILSYVPQKLTGISFARFAVDNIFKPLGMTASTFNYQTALNSKGGLAFGMSRGGWNPYADPFAGTPRQQRWWAGTNADDDGNTLSGAGGMLTTAVDMAQWLKALLLKGQNPDTGKQVVPADVVDTVASAIIPSGPYLPAFPEYSIPMYGAAQLQLYYRGHYILEHGGFIQGFNTQISRMPLDGIGISVLSNDNEHGMQIGEVIKNYIYDRALGLEPIDWDSRYKAIKSVAPQAATKRPAAPKQPAVDLSKLVGSYSNLGYGTLDFCQITPAPQNPSAACKQLASNLTTILPGGIDSTVPTLLAQYDSPWFSHMKLQHFDGNVFNISLISSTPVVGGTQAPANASYANSQFWTYNPRPDGSDQVAVAEFDIAGSKIGLGMTGVWQGILGSGIPPTSGNTVKERAEVYWDKH